MSFHFEDFRKRVKKTEDNATVIESANEQVKLITDKYLPKVKTWLQGLAKISGNIYQHNIIIFIDITALDIHTPVLLESISISPFPKCFFILYLS